MIGSLIEKDSFLAMANQLLKVRCSTSHSRMPGYAPTGGSFPPRMREDAAEDLLTLADLCRLWLSICHVQVICKEMPATRGGWGGS
jgi:hypothetical protein